MLRRAPCALPCLMTPDAVQMSLPAFACAPESACQADLRRPHSAGHRRRASGALSTASARISSVRDGAKVGDLQGRRRTAEGLSTPSSPVSAPLGASRAGGPKTALRRPVLGRRTAACRAKRDEARARGREGFAAAFLCGDWGKDLAERTTGARRGWVRRRACPRRRAACGCPAAGRQSGRFCRRRSPSRDAGQAWRS